MTAIEPIAAEVEHAGTERAAPRVTAVRRLVEADAGDAPGAARVRLAGADVDRVAACIVRVDRDRPDRVDPERAGEVLPVRRTGESVLRPPDPSAGRSDPHAALARVALLVDRDRGDAAGREVRIRDVVRRVAERRRPGRAPGSARSETHCPGRPLPRGNFPFIALPAASEAASFAAEISVAGYASAANFASSAEPGPSCDSPPFPGIASFSFSMCVPVAAGNSYSLPSSSPPRIAPLSVTAVATAAAATSTSTTATSPCLRLRVIRLPLIRVTPRVPAARGRAEPGAASNPRGRRNDGSTARGGAAWSPRPSGRRLAQDGADYNHHRSEV